MDYVQYDFAYMYTYSERPGTLAAKRFEDDIPDDVKTRRFNEILTRQQECSFKRLQQHIGKTHRVLIDGFSKKSDKDFSGKSEHNITVVRSEEHTSELQSLMRNSYAVFCLNKTIKTT